MKKCINKKFGIVLTAILLICISVNPTYGESNDITTIESKILSDDFSLDNLSEQDRDYLQNHEALAQKRADKDLEYIKKHIKSEISNKLSTLELTRESVWLGTDKILSTCNYENVDGDSFMGGTYNAVADASSKYADAESKVYIWQGAGSWAIVGVSALVCGNQGDSEEANIIYRGAYRGTVGQNTGASCNGTVAIVVYDWTDNYYVAERTVLDRDGTNPASTYSGSIAHTLGDIELEAGHNYIFYIIVETAATSSGGNAWADFYNNSSGGDGLRFTSVKVDF